MLLGRAEILGAARVGALLAKASDPGATVPEKHAYRVKARQLAGKLPNGPGVLAALDKEDGDGHEQARVPGL